MTARLRQILGLAGVTAAAALAFWLLTSPSQSRLETAQAATLQLGEQEADLLQRVAGIEAAKSSSGRMSADLLWTGVDDASVEISQQQALVDLANEAGLQILSFGATQGPERLGHPTKAYEIEVEGGHAEVARLLAGIEQFQPRLAISYFWARQIPVTEGQAIAPVNMRLAVWGFSATGQGGQP